jgi:hypothetical protein
MSQRDAAASGKTGEGRVNDFPDGGPWPEPMHCIATSYISRTPSGMASASLNRFPLTMISP